jgi:uncharacterized membrane protein
MAKALQFALFSFLSKTGYTMRAKVSRKVPAKAENERDGEEEGDRVWGEAAVVVWLMVQ